MNVFQYPLRWVAGIATLSLLLLAHWNLRQYAVDDAYIHFRIARNFVETGYPYYNRGSAVFATTAPLWTVLLSALYWLTDAPLPFIALLLNSVFTFLNVLVWGALLSRVSAGRVLWGNWLAAVLVVAVLFDSSVGLMETPLALLLVGSALLVCGKRVSLAFVLLSLAVFVRPEAILFLIATWLCIVWFDRPRALRAVVAAVVAAVPFVLWEIHYFSTVVPNSMSAKRTVYELSQTDFVHLFFHGIFGGEIAGQHRAVVAGYVIVLCGLVAVAILTEKSPAWYRNAWVSFWRILLPGLCGVLILGAYFVARAPLASWYMPLYELPILFSLVALAGLRERLVLTFMVAVAVSPFLFRLARNSVAVVFELPEFYTDFAAGARVRQYLVIGREIRERMPEARLLSSEIGGLGYSFEGTVLDAAGLVTPAALEWHPMQVPDQRQSGLLGSIPAGFVEATRPEVIVSMDVFLSDFLQSPIRNDYQLFSEPLFRADDFERRGDRELWGATEMVIAVRNDIAASNCDDRCESYRDAMS